MTVRWRFTDVRTGDNYDMQINPNSGGSVGFTKAIAVDTPIGPGRQGLLSEGRIQPDPMEFSGVILTQAQLENMETWALKRTLIQIVDDLGRTYQGVLSDWKPSRERRAFNYWYHTYSATLTVSAIKTAGGATLFGTVQAVGV